MRVPESLFEELKHYVGFGETDERALRALHPLAAPEFIRIADVFYQRILDHDGSRKVLTEGESTVGRLKVTLVAWMDKLLSGPWDEAYFELRCRIGRVHVRINMPQHYMFGAMNVVRRELTDLADARLAADRTARFDARHALGRIIDLELAIMLHTYREDLLAQQGRTERLATFGQLVGSIGHELRNPLGVIESSLFILAPKVQGDPSAARHVTRIGEQVDIASSIIRDLLDLIRDKPVVRERVELSQVIERAAGQVRFPAEVKLRLEGLVGLPEVEVEESQLRQVFVNLLENAVHAAADSGEVRVVASATDGEVCVAVEDTGPGVDPVTRQRLFEPLVTTKQKGIGLGLALVKRIVERHRGTIAYEPRTRGARFVVRLPRSG